MKPARPTLAAPDHALLPIRLHSHPIPIYADSRTIDPTMVFVDGFVRFRLERKKEQLFAVYALLVGLCVMKNSPHVYSVPGVFPCQSETRRPTMQREEVRGCVNIIAC